MRRILIDADTGIDDSLAILYALRSPNIRVEGITTCFGNNNAAQSAENCIRLIHISNCGYEVPVVVGAKESIDGVFSSAPAYIHGDNGIGNAELPESSQKPLEMSAEDFIIQKAEELQQNLTLVTTGRMTNLAKALQKEPGIAGKIGRVVSMGGTIYEPGNVGVHAEANIGGDARAADIVFRAGLPLILVGLDVTMKTIIRKEDIDSLEKNCREDCRQIAAYLKRAYQLYFEFHRVSLGMRDACVTHDPLAMLIAEDPSLGTYKMIRAGVEYESKKYEGMIIWDQDFTPVLDRKEIAVCMDVDSDLAVRRLFSVFQDRTYGKYNK